MYNDYNMPKLRKIEIMSLFEHPFGIEVYDNFVFRFL